MLLDYAIPHEGDPRLYPPVGSAQFVEWLRSGLENHAAAGGGSDPDVRIDKVIEYLGNYGFAAVFFAQNPGGSRIELFRAKRFYSNYLIDILKPLGLEPVQEWKPASPGIFAVRLMLLQKER